MAKKFKHLLIYNRNIFKEVNVIKNRGHPGTGLTTAPVLLFELLSAINCSSTSHLTINVKTGGKPSTWISAGGLVEQVIF